MAYFGGNQVFMFAAALHGANVALQAVGIAVSTVMEALARLMDQVARVPGPWQDTARSIAGSMHAAALSMANDFAAISNPRITVHVAVVRDNSTNAVYGGGGKYVGGAAARRERPIAMLGDRHVASRNNQRHGGGDIQSMMTITTRTTNIYCTLWRVYGD